MKQSRAPALPLPGQSSNADINKDDMPGRNITGLGLPSPKECYERMSGLGSSSNTSSAVGGEQESAIPVSALRALLDRTRRDLLLRGGAYAGRGGGGHVGLPNSEAGGAASSFVFGAGDDDNPCRKLRVREQLLQALLVGKSEATEEERRRRRAKAPAGDFSPATAAAAAASSTAASAATASASAVLEADEAAVRRQQRRTILDAKRAGGGGGQDSAIRGRTVPNHSRNSTLLSQQQPDLYHGHAPRSSDNARVGIPKKKKPKSDDGGLGKIEKKKKKKSSQDIGQ